MTISCSLSVVLLIGLASEIGPSDGVDVVQGADLEALLLKLDQTVRQTEKAERAVKASQRRRAPKPGGAVQRKRSLLRRPRNTKPVHLGRQDQPIKRPIMTASQIGTAQRRMSTNVSVMEGFLRNSMRSKMVSSMAYHGNYMERNRSLP